MTSKFNIVLFLCIVIASLFPSVLSTTSDDDQIDTSLLFLFEQPQGRNISLCGGVAVSTVHILTTPPCYETLKRSGTIYGLDGAQTTSIEDARVSGDGLAVVVTLSSPLRMSQGGQMSDGRSKNPILSISGLMNPCRSTSASIHSLVPARSPPTFLFRNMAAILG